MSDCGLDCDLGGCFDCDCDCDCLDGDCCGGCLDGDCYGGDGGCYNFNCYHCGTYFSCCNFNCFGADGDSWLFFSNSSRSNRNSEPSCCCCCWGGGGSVGSPPHRTVKPKPKPKKRSRLKRMLMFWKAYSENDQEQKAAEKQLDDMSGEQACYHKSGPPHKHAIKREEEAAPTVTNINHGPLDQWPMKIPRIGWEEEAMMKPIPGYRGPWQP